MQLSLSSKANRTSASEEITHILWKQFVHYRFHNSPATITTNPLHALQPTS